MWLRRFKVTSQPGDLPRIICTLVVTCTLVELQVIDPCEINNQDLNA